MFTVLENGTEGARRIKTILWGKISAFFRSPGMITWAQCNKADKVKWKMKTEIKINLKPNFAVFLI